MPRYQLVALSVVLSLLSGCTVLSGLSPEASVLNKDSATEEARSQREILIGKWYRTQPLADGGSIREAAMFKEDGTYRFEFRVADASGETEEFGSIGFWGISGGIHFTIERVKFDDRGTFAVDPADPDHYLAYRVLKLSPEKFTHKALVTGNVFTLKRVPAVPKE